MVHIAELLDLTPADVYGTASFYEMFVFEPIGRYCINICTNISCQLLGAWELLEHAEHRLGTRPGTTTDDGMFTLEDVECIAACTEAPALQVNYRYRNQVTNDDFDQLVDDLAAGRLDDEIPPFGTLAGSASARPTAGPAPVPAAQAKVDARDESSRPGPRIVTSRFDVADGYTYDGYVRTGGYTALRRALTRDDAAAGAR